MDRTAFSMGSFSEADRRSMGDNLKINERFAWVTKTVRRAFGYLPGERIPFDRAAFSMRKRDDSSDGG